MFWPSRTKTIPLNSTQIKAVLNGVPSDFFNQGNDNIVLKYSFTPVGIRELDRQFGRVTQAVRNAAALTVKEEAEWVKRRSQFYVPFDTGNLHDSAYTEKDPSEEFLPSYLVGYDVGKAWYAWIQHEDLTLKHPMRFGRTSGGFPVPQFLARARDESIEFFRQTAIRRTGEYLAKLNIGHGRLPKESTE